MAKTIENAHCVIGEGSVFDGRFYVSGSILIEGKFQGDIKTDDQVIIGPTGKVKTDITAKKVTIAGTIIGNISATEEVNLLQSGKVLGNITTPKLIVEPGVITEGKVTITSGNDSNVKSTIEESFGPSTEDMFKSLAGVKKSIKKTNEESST
ncbi:MAG: polymer-forming cytoskeletal protein [Spirochaetales bacterium]|nr:polymer-forming cytoskeletal protein [Spirochaetales bacterium]